MNHVGNVSSSEVLSPQPCLRDYFECEVKVGADARAIMLSNKVVLTKEICEERIRRVLRCANCGIVAWLEHDTASKILDAEPAETFAWACKVPLEQK